jgi:hypothetical protein
VIADEVEEVREPSSHRGKLVGSQSARLCYRVTVREFVSANRCRDHLGTCRYVTKLRFHHTVLAKAKGYLMAVTSGFSVERQNAG